MGNKTLGQVRINGEVFEAVILCKKLGILVWNTNQAKLQPGDLTPKRLARLFRYQIQDYIKSGKGFSFLFRKHSNYEDDWAVDVFPGAEYLVHITDSEALVLAYREVDRVNGTKFEARVKQIISARFPGEAFPVIVMHNYTAEETIEETKEEEKGESKRKVKEGRRHK